jgi:hypothetical protein
VLKCEREKVSFEIMKRRLLMKVMKKICRKEYSAK